MENITTDLNYIQEQLAELQDYLLNASRDVTNKNLKNDIYNKLQVGLEKLEAECNSLIEQVDEGLYDESELNEDMFSGDEDNYGD